MIPTLLIFVVLKVFGIDSGTSQKISVTDLYVLPKDKSFSLENVPQQVNYQSLFVEISLKFLLNFGSLALSPFTCIRKLNSLTNNCMKLTFMNF